jgi:DNA-binding transcriptional LysR family regulator
MQVKPPRRAVLGALSDADIRLLRVFRAVADCGGMAAAELELNIATSTISRHIKDLETRLGLTLCRRGRGGFALTPEGERVHAETLRLLAATDAFRASIDDLHQRMGGELHVALFDKTASNPAAQIAQALAAFRAQASDVHLNLHVGTLSAIERGVMDGQFQLGIIPEHRRSQSLRYDELFGETMRLYCGVTHPLWGADDATLDWTSVGTHAFAGLGYHSPNMEVVHARGWKRAATGFDQEAVATLILSGAFIGFLPDHYAAAFVQSGRMRALAPERLGYDCMFSAITRRSPAPSRATALLRACLVQAHAGARGSGSALP